MSSHPPRPGSLQCHHTSSLGECTDGMSGTQTGCQHRLSPEEVQLEGRILIIWKYEHNSAAQYLTHTNGEVHSVLLQVMHRNLYQYSKWNKNPYQVLQVTCAAAERAVVTFKWDLFSLPWCHGFTVLISLLQGTIRHTTIHGGNIAEKLVTHQGGQDKL